MARSSSRVVGGIALAVGALLGCTEDARLRCAFGDEHVVATTARGTPDGLDLVAHDGQLLAAWSEPAGLFLQPLSEQGVPAGAPTRLGPRCRGGLDLESTADGGALLACLRPAEPAHDDAGAAVLYMHARGGALSVSMLGTAGPASRGISVARTHAGASIAFEDADDARSQVWRADVPGSRLIIVSDRHAGSPSLLAHAGGLWTAWRETELDAAGVFSGRIRVETGHGASREVASVGGVDARPRLVALDGGQVVLAFRDVRGASKRPALHLQRLGEDQAPRGATLRVGRANGTGDTSLCACSGGLLAASPRTYQKDALVGLVFVDGTVQRKSGEQQFYEDGLDFSYAAAACIGTGEAQHLVVLIGEGSTSVRPFARLRTVVVRCR